MFAGPLTRIARSTSSLRLSSHGWDQEHRSRRRTHKLKADAAQEGFREETASAGPHHDQVILLFARDADDLLTRQTVRDFDPDLSGAPLFQLGPQQFETLTVNCVEFFQAMGQVLFDVRAILNVEQRDTFSATLDDLLDERKRAFGRLGEVGAVQMRILSNIIPLPGQGRIFSATAVSFVRYPSRIAG